MKPDRDWLFPEPEVPPLRWWQVALGGVAVAAVAFGFFWIVPMALFVATGVR